MITTITRDELRAKQQQGDDFYLVETLPEMYYRHTHLPGALNLPPSEVRHRASQLLPDQTAFIVLYCADQQCQASASVARELEEMGYTNLHEYQGGKQDWIEAELPTEGESRQHSSPGNA